MQEGSGARGRNNRVDAISKKRYVSRMDIERQLRQAAKGSGMSVKALANKAQLAYASAHRFVNGDGLTLKSAARLARVLGLELVPMKRPKRNG